MAASYWTKEKMQSEIPAAEINVNEKEPIPREFIPFIRSTY